MPSKLIIWGASGHARVVADIIRVAGTYEIAGFLDDQHPEHSGHQFEGATILGGRECLAAQRARGIAHLVVAFGHCAGRLEAARFATGAGFMLATAIHPSAVIAASTRVGAGSVIAANAVVNPYATIGENAIINTSASVDHDCAIDEGVHIAPGAHLSGRVRVGAASWIGAGATIIDGCSVGSNTIIGAGAVVVDDIPSDVIAYGVPARVIRRNE
ncbi:MAG: sugar acetyltransferase [Acidobacteria bacterium]|nr:MAG: sugar acetyltransferase [Acidobacteriota bacterium]